MPGPNNPQHVVRPDDISRAVVSPYGLRPVPALAPRLHHTKVNAPRSAGNDMTPTASDTITPATSSDLDGLGAGLLLS